MNRFFHSCITVILIVLLSDHAARAQNSLWGLTQKGGVHTTGNGRSAGTLFEYNPTTGIYKKWFDFSQADGYEPQGNLLYHNGKFYGMTAYGGQNGNGVLFEFDPVSKVYTRKVNFNTGTGTSPEGGGLIAYNGKLYGMTRAGGMYDRGTIFAYDPATNAIGVIYNFVVAALGYAPNGSLMEHNGQLYGLTGTGGVNGYGALFYIDPVNLSNYAPYYFSLSSGIAPLGGPMEYNGRLYGTTANYGSGSSNGKGTIFSYDLSGGFTNIDIEYQFFVADSGAMPCGDLTAYNNRLYGLTNEGGVNGRCVLFEFDPVTKAFRKKHDFGGNSSYSGPLGSLTLYDGKLYGTTYKEGNVDSGVLFSYEPATNTYTKVYDFDGVNGAYPAYSKLTVAPSAPTSVAGQDMASLVQLYPNPVRDELCVSLRGVREAMLFLTDAAGRDVRRWEIREGVNKVWLGDLGVGIYLCRVVDVDGRVLVGRRVTIQR